LLMGHEWADTAATRHSYELIARYVAPRFQGSSESLTSSRDWAAENRPEFIGAAGNAVMSAIQKHHEEKAEKAGRSDTVGHEQAAPRG
jgi:limonene 1,2-monooxygenase